MTAHAHDTTTPAIDEVTALQRAHGDLEAVVANLTTDQLSLDTACPGWDVRALINHTLGTAVMFTRVNAGDVVGEDAGDLVGDDPVDAVGRISSANIDSWRSPGALEGMRTYPWGTFPARIGLVINISEVAVHAWDVAVATSQPAVIDADVARVVLDFYSQISLDDFRAHGVFGAEVTVPSTATVQERLLGLLGRAT